MSSMLAIPPGAQITGITYVDSFSTAQPPIPQSVKRFLEESGWTVNGPHSVVVPDKYAPDCGWGYTLHWSEALAYETFQRFTLGTMR